MRLNNLDFLETLKQDNQVCGGESDSDYSDVDVVVDKSQDADLVFEFNLTPVNASTGEVSGWIRVFDPTESDGSPKYIWDGEEVESPSVITDWLNS